MLWEEQAGKSASSGLDDREGKWLLIRTKWRIWPRRWCIKRKERRGGNERTGMGCADSVDIRIKAGGSEKTKGIGKRGRERAKRFCRQRWAGRGQKGMMSTRYLLTAPISTAAGTFCHVAKFPTFRKGEPGREPGRPARPSPSPVRWKEQTRTFLVQILVGL